MNTEKTSDAESWAGPVGSLGGFGTEELERMEREGSLLRPLEVRRLQNERFIADSETATASDRAAMASEGLTDDEMLLIRRTAA